jgi:threonine synthase
MIISSLNTKPYLATATLFMMKNITLILSFLFSVSSIFGQKNPFQVSFGSGGGFTGIYTTYSLNSKDKKISKALSNNNQKAQLIKLKKKQVQEIGHEISAANFPAMNINTPGNMSNFVNVTIGGKEYKTTWSGTTSGNASLDALYQNLLSFIPKK